MSYRYKILPCVSALALLSACSGEPLSSDDLDSTHSALHSWGGYHWARTANPFTLKLGDNVTAAWDPYLVTTSADWSQSTVLDTVIVAGTVNPRTCKATAGRVQVCNAKYGNNGWLGIANIWLTGGTHITQGTARMNDTYFSTATYNKPAYRNLVMCQEVAHTFGLDHQDENQTNANLGSCMDYTNNPAGPPSNERPNAHDFEELELIYAHLDGTSTVDQTGTSAAAAAGVAGDSPSDWGTLVRQSRDGRRGTYVRQFGPDHAMVTHVLWAD